MEKKLPREGLVQLFKYGIVGVSNTLISLVAIYIAQEIIQLSPTISNIIGYIVGLINSFVWNSKWTFKSKMSIRTLTLFTLCFLFCFLVQLKLMLLLNEWHDWELQLRPYTSKFEFINQVIAMGVYTILNFVMNKYITYAKSNKK